MSRETAAPRSRYRRNRRPQEQMDLFTGDQRDGAIGAPAWPELPPEARAAATGLMKLLILAHAAQAATGPSKEAGHDL